MIDGEAIFVLTRSDVERLLNPAKVLQPLREGFIAHSKRALPSKRLHAELPVSGSATAVMPGLLDGIPAYTAKVHSKFPGGRPSIKGVLCLYSTVTGALLAVMDSTYLTGVRTGLAGALAADVLGRPEASTVAVIGAGAQNRHQLSALTMLRRISRVHVYDIEPPAARRFATDLGSELDLDMVVSATLPEAVGSAELVLIATWSRSPLIDPGMLSPGAHVSTLGVDEPGKSEVSSSTLRAANVFCDDRDLAASVGVLNGTGISRGALTEIGEVLGQARPGRRTAEETTIFAAVGLAFQDVACAWRVYERAIEEGIGARVNFLG